MEPVIRENGPEKKETAEGVLRLLRLSLQLLAADAHVQTSHFSPHSVVLTDEMALDFDHWADCIDTYWQLTQQHATTLATLNDFLQHLSVSQEAAFWAEEALFTDPRWDEVRMLAKTALTAFGWPIEVPPPARWSGNTFIDGI